MLVNHILEKNENKQTEINTPLYIGEKEIHSLAEIKENFSVNEMLSALNDGSLEKFLRSRFYEREALSVASIKLDDKECIKKLCKVFGVEYSKYAPINTPEMQERLAKIEEFTNDREVLENFQKVALNQEELAKLLSLDEKIIYLCHNIFTIPLSKNGIKYIGVDNATIDNPFTKKQYLKAGITVENIALPEKVSDEMSEYAANVAVKNGYDDYKDKNLPLATYFHNKLKNSFPFYGIRLPYNASIVSKRFKSKYTAEQELKETLKKPYDKAQSYLTVGNAISVSKTLSAYYSDFINNCFNPVIEQLKTLYSLKGKSENFNSLSELVRNSKKILLQKFEDELSNSADYYGMYKFDYFVDSVSIDKNDFRVEKGFWGALEALVGDSIDYTYSDLYSTVCEMEKDVNDRLATFYKSAYAEYLAYLGKIEKEIEVLGSDLPEFNENEDIKAYITRITVANVQP